VRNCGVIKRPLRRNLERANAPSVISKSITFVASRLIGNRFELAEIYRV
jgi:hypothetical protein